MTLALIAAVVAGTVVFEAAMAPTGSDRLELIAVFVASALVAAGVAQVMPRWARRARSIRWTITAVPIAALAIAAAAVVGAAGLMFISSHDLRLLAVVVLFAATLGAIVAVGIASPIAEDLERIAKAVDAIDDPAAPSSMPVRRDDEVGRVADAIDAMAQRLGELEAARAEDELARRQFIAAIGHDLRTPIAAVRAAIDALQDGVADDPDRYLDAMSRDVKALTDLVDDLFLLSRIDAGDVAFGRINLDVAELADDAVEALRPSARARGVALRVLSPGRVGAVGGPEALSRVLRNLLDNAIRHSPRDGEVVVRVEAEPSPTVSVVDEGPGFPEHFTERAFATFERADASRTRATGGAGLGLAVARGIVVAHGGAIWAEPGPGGRVVFRLPSETELAAV